MNITSHITSAIPFHDVHREERPAQEIVGTPSQTFLNRKKLSGCESLRNYILTYNYACLDLYLSDEQKLKCWDYLFKNDSLISFSK